MKIKEVNHNLPNFAYKILDISKSSPYPDLVEALLLSLFVKIMIAFDVTGLPSASILGIAVKVGILQQLKPLLQHFHDCPS